MATSKRTREHELCEHDTRTLRTLADGVGGMQDRELRILMERGAEQLLVSAPLRQLRLVAQHKKLDLSDALEEVARLCREHAARGMKRSRPEV